MWVPEDNASLPQLLLATAQNLQWVHQLLTQEGTWDVLLLIQLFDPSTIANTLSKVNPNVQRADSSIWGVKSQMVAASRLSLTTS